MKKILLILLCTIFIFNMVNAEIDLGERKQGECIDLKQTCTNCTFVNLTEVFRTGANSTTWNINREMTKNGINYGFFWNGTQWKQNDSIIDGLIDSGGNNYYTTFEIDEVWSTISGDGDGKCFNYEFTEEVADTTPPTFTDIANITQDNETAVYYDINATDTSGLGIFWINDTTNFKIDSSTGIFENNSALNIGVYPINVSVNDTLGYLTSQTIYVNLTEVEEEPENCWIKESKRLIIPPTCRYEINVKDFFI